MHGGGGLWLLAAVAGRLVTATLEAPGVLWAARRPEWEGGAGRCEGAAELPEVDYQGRRACGWDVFHACPAGKADALPTDDAAGSCGRCYLLTALRAAVAAPQCTAGECPALQRAFYVQVTSGLSPVDIVDREFDLDAAGWATACPQGCAAAEGSTAADVCVAEEQQCLLGLVTEGRGGAATRPLAGAWQEVDCRSGVARGEVVQPAVASAETRGGAQASATGDAMTAMGRFWSVSAAFILLSSTGMISAAAL